MLCSLWLHAVGFNLFAIFLPQIYYLLLISFLAVRSALFLHKMLELEADLYFVIIC